MTKKQQRVRKRMHRNKGEYPVRCAECGKEIKKGRGKPLQHSMTDDGYYRDLPDSHKSQGWKMFGYYCAKKVRED